MLPGKLISVLIPVALGLGGCATVVNGPNLDYSIDSEPGGANVRMSNGAECVTPCELSLKRRYDLRADFSREGYKPAYVLIESKTGGATVGNILAGGVIGAVVDSGNGSNSFLSPRPLKVRLAPADSDSEAQLLDKSGKVTSSVAAHNDDVREDVVAVLGRKLSGYEDDDAAESEVAEITRDDAEESGAGFGADEADKQPAGEETASTAADGAEAGE